MEVNRKRVNESITKVKVGSNTDLCRAETESKQRETWSIIQAVAQQFPELDVFTDSCTRARKESNDGAHKTENQTVRQSAHTR